MSANARVTTATDWRIQLQEEIRQIQERGGPPPEGETILLQVPLSEFDVEQFATVSGQVNDLPFGTALPGTLEIRPPARWADGTAQLAFVFRPNPPKHFGSSAGLMQARGPHGGYPLVVLGVDFNALPGLLFPIEREELDAIKQGLKHDVVVPVPRGVSVAPGQSVNLVEARVDPFGAPLIVPRAGSLAVRVTVVKAIDQNYSWAGRRLYRIEWDPDDVRDRFAGAPAEETRSRIRARKA